MNVEHYKASDLKLKRYVALKMVLIGEHASAEQLARFRVEAETVARLRHSNIVQIFDVGEYRGQPFLTFELVEGVSLARFAEDLTGLLAKTANPLLRTPSTIFVLDHKYFSLIENDSKLTFFLEK